MLYVLWPLEKGRGKRWIGAAFAYFDASVAFRLSSPHRIVQVQPFRSGGIRTLLSTVRLSETFLEMAVVGMGESLEETARMVTPARRGHADLAWGNVVGTVVVLLTFNLGVIALVRPVSVDPFVLRFHVPYLLASTVSMACLLLMARRLRRRTGLVLVSAYLLYLAVNLTHMWSGPAD